MACILIATSPASGHVTPMVSVARELVNRGHKVLWYTGKAFQSKIELLGASYRPMNAAYDYSGMKHRDEAFPQLHGLEGLSALVGCWKYVFIEPAIRQMEDILKLLEEFPADLLVADETCFGMGFVHEKTGIPWILTNSSIYMYSSKDTAPIGLGLPPDSSPLGRIRNATLRFFLDNIALRNLRNYIDQTRDRVGLPKLNTSVLERVNKRPNLYLLGTVPSFEYPRSDMYEHTHFVGAFFSPPPEQFDPPTWWDDLHSNRPVIHITQGTVSNEPDDLLIPAIRALVNEDVLVVVATGGRPVESINLDPLPENVRVERFIPYYFFLPYVDIMVTNGGFNGIQAALSNGIPLVVAGTTEEKFEVAAHIAWAGAGINLKTQTPSEAQIRNAVKTILRDPAYKRNAQRLQAEYKSYNGPQLAANLIEKFLS
jgi:MGT family glycosyltransferase